MQAVVDFIDSDAAVGCFRRCGQVARFYVWADWTNEDGEHGDFEPLEACEMHLGAACMTKMKETPS
jgi:hypothetical protein